MRSIPVKLFLIWTTGSGDVVKRSLFLALVVILFSRAVLFVQFW